MCALLPKRSLSPASLRAPVVNLGADISAWLSAPAQKLPGAVAAESDRAEPSLTPLREPPHGLLSARAPGSQVHVLI